MSVEERREGGVNEYTHKLPGPSNYTENLTFRHGMTAIDTLWNWFHAASKGVIKRKSGTILLLDSERLPVMWWHFKDAFPVAFFFAVIFSNCLCSAEFNIHNVLVPSI